LEAKVPGASIFQWPIKGYPETPMLEKLPHYEPMWVYMLSHSLHFSYGDCMGRVESQWQWELKDSDPQTLLETIQSYGFSAFLLYRQGLTKEQLAIWDGFARKPDFTSEDGQHWIYLLTPGTGHPPLRPVLSYIGFLGQEKGQGMTWRWSSSTGQLTLILPPEMHAHFICSLNSFGQERDFEVRLDGHQAWAGKIRCGTDYEKIDVELPGGHHRLDFIPSGSTNFADDGTALSFRIIDFKLQENP
jgi:hypothetical protein